ncbi:HAD family hydrolase [bacterium D16-51]|nr:HAD family hydrolase [bacterium D16-59]RKI60259.1 HAD family hydrolase [bacterium D16-51]
MFQPKLIITDLDGTALKNDKTISKATVEAFTQCRNSGIPSAIATARYLGGAMPFAKALHAKYQILTDGTLVYEKGSLIYSNAMNVETTNAIIKELQKYHCTTHIAIPTAKRLYRYPRNSIKGKNDCCFSLENPFPYPGNKIVAELPDESIADKIAQKCQCCKLRYRGENRYAFYNKTAGKLDAIRYLTQRTGISLNDILVFGDDQNDIEMITHCGYGVAMGNAAEEVKAAANEVTDSNENDGIAKVLSRFFP